MNRTRFITQSAIIAAIYIGLTIVFAPISYREIQVRVSEILTILPYFTPAAIPGLFIGCLVANVFGPNGITDIVIGSLATLIAAVLSYKMRRKPLVPLPPVLVNAIMVGVMLGMLYNIPVWMSVLYVAAGQAVTCYGIGYPLLLFLNRYRDRVFR